MAELLQGNPVADALCAELEPRIRACADAGMVPTLAVIRVGAREDDLSYERSLLKRFNTLELGVRLCQLPEDCSQDALMDAIRMANEDPSIHGVLLFRPLPAHLDEQAACNTLLPEKDVDGITAGSLYGVFAGRPVGFAPCTADACLELLRFYDVTLDGANAVVIGRSLVIGRPVSLMLQAANATVTMAHTHTRDLDAITRAADVVVVAAGHVDTLGTAGVRPGQVVVDVGINWDDAAGKLVGDVSFAEVEPVVSALTPVPGGVGSVTTAVLAAHVVQAAERTLG